jgi:hypothetical protein
MRGWAFVFAIVAMLSLPAVARAVLTVNPPRPIAYQVNVQLIQTALDDGSTAATVFGDANQRAAIEASVDAIWAQAGIDINFLPNIVRYNNTFAYQGDTATRPASDLGRILSDAAATGDVLNSNPFVLDMFLVNVVPGWSLKPENWANGTSNVGENGISEFIGDTLLTTDHGRDHAAHWVAHEIGHNLGLRHTAAGVSNLMSTSRTTDQLTDEQIDAIFQRQTRNDAVAYIPTGGTGFPQLLPEFVPGDFNRDGSVDGSDYTLVRDTWGSKTNLLADSSGNGVIDTADWLDWKAHFGLGTIGSSLAGDFNHDGAVDAADYTLWLDNYGSTTNLAADANKNGSIDYGDYAVWLSNFGKGVVVGGSGGVESVSGVPEPATWVTVLIAVAAGVLGRRQFRSLRSGGASQ